MSLISTGSHRKALLTPCWHRPFWPEYGYDFDMNNPEPVIPDLSLDPTTLTQVVRLALGHETAVIKQWQAQPGGASQGAATAGVYRVSGVARDGDTPLDWTVILKIIRPAAAAFNPATREMDHAIYWKREALVYQ